MNDPCGAGARWLTATLVVVGLWAWHPGRLPAAGSPYANRPRPTDHAEHPPSLVVQPPKDVTPKVVEVEGPGGPSPQQAPEPGSLILFGAGLAGLVTWARRRRGAAVSGDGGQVGE